jgi:hypothetical protein
VVRKNWMCGEKSKQKRQKRAKEALVVRKKRRHEDLLHADGETVADAVQEREDISDANNQINMGAKIYT